MFLSNLSRVGKPPVLHAQIARIQRRRTPKRISIVNFSIRAAYDEPDLEYGIDDESYGGSSERRTGVVKWFSAKKGFGFIQQDDGSGDIFVHQTNIVSEGYRSLRDGEAVEYEAIQSQDGRLTAIDVTGPDGREPLGSDKEDTFNPSERRPPGSRYYPEPNVELPEGSSGLQVVVHNIPWSVTEERLDDFFADVAPVEAEVRYDELGRSRGFGVLKFDSVEDSTRAIMEYHGKNLDGRTIVVRFDRFG